MQSIFSNALSRAIAKHVGLSTREDARDNLRRRSNLKAPPMATSIYGDLDF
jgi:hypothetical protein